MFKRFLMAGAIAILLVPILAGCSFSVGNIGCLYSEPRSAELPLEGVTSVRIEARAGNLTVQGTPGATALIAQGTACSSRGSDLAEIQVQAERQGSEAVLTVMMPSLSSWGSRQVDLVVAIPESLPVRVTASAGNFEADRLASLDLEKGAGNVLVDGITGDLISRTSSGTIRVMSVQGNATIRASAGNLYMDGMGGTVTIPTKSSGTVTINGVKGDLILGDISSGNLTVNGVSGAMKLQEKSAGNVKITGIGGSLLLDDVSSGDLEVSGVIGELRVGEKSAGTVRIAGIGQSVLLGDISSGNLYVERVGGSVNLRQKSAGTISISEVERDVLVQRASSGTLAVKRVKGSLTVESKGAGAINFSEIGGRVQTPQR